MGKKYRLHGSTIFRFKLFCSINLSLINAQPFDVGDKNLKPNHRFLNFRGFKKMIISTALPPIAASFDYGFT